MQQALVYTRISSDVSGSGAGVERQREECERLAERLGVEIVGVYTDNNISAYGGYPRPSYDALVNALISGEAKCLIVYDLDRLYRQLRELEDFIKVVESHGIRTETVNSGPYDLNTSFGRKQARDAISLAMWEVERGRERMKSAKSKSARAGQYSGGKRPFGYEPDGVTIREHEAQTIREMASMLIDGKSYNQIAIEMNARGIKTATGMEWRAIRVQNILTRKRYIGIRIHKGAEYPATWPAILSLDTWDQVQAAASVRRSLYKQRGTFRKNMLIGFVFCGHCGARLLPGLKTSRHGKVGQTYRCLHFRGNEPDGCGKVTRNMAPIDDLISDAVVYRLNSPQMREELARQHTDDELPLLIRMEQAQETLIQELLEDRASGLLSRAEYARAKDLAEVRLTSIRADIARHSSGVVLSLPSTAITREQWDASSIEWRRSILDVLIKKIVVMPVGKRDMKTRYKEWIFNPKLIDIRWSV